MNFKDYRSKIGTQVDLANMLKVHKSTVNKWELGLSYPRIVALGKLSELFGVSKDTVLDSITQSKADRS